MQRQKRQRTQSKARFDWTEGREELLVSLSEAKTPIKEIASIMQLEEKQVKNKLAAMR